jgi:ribosome-associated protein
MMSDERLPETDAERPPSKSARKREGLALQQLAETLLALPAKQLAEVPLSDQLRKALADSRTVTQHEARRRQLQYLGKLMRDADSAAILNALAEFEHRNRHFRRHLDHTDSLCTRLCVDGDPAIEALLADHPGLDRQQLRQLVRNAKGATDPQAPARRKLFDYVRVHLG